MTTLNNDRGFSLIEVLLVVVIVGVLSGIALSQYASDRAPGVDTRVASAVRQVATGEEAYCASHLAYTMATDEVDGIVSEDIVIEVSAGNSGDLATSFRVEASHPAADHAYVWISDRAPGELHLSEV